jgi:GNAT superfamily N-acetyltransferase
LAPVVLPRAGWGRSSLALPADRARLEAALAGDEADGYLVQTCWDGIPEAWLAGRAELSRRMSTDIPMGDLQLEEERWDEERVRAEYERIAAMGRRVVDTLAVVGASGELVGYSQVQVPRDNPVVGFQQDTLVMREHRGHGLGLRMKAVSTLALMQESPATKGVRTWNADDNAPMLKVNRTIGYVHDAMMREWQKVVAS